MLIYYLTHRLSNHFLFLNTPRGITPVALTPTLGDQIHLTTTLAWIPLIIRLSSGTVPAPLFDPWLHTQANVVRPPSGI